MQDNLFLDNPMTKEELRQNLMLFTPRNITLVINENHSIFLSVLEKKRKDLKLSLHRFFLLGTLYVCEAIIRYCIRRDKEALKVLRIFTNRYFLEVDYSHKIDPKKLQAKGIHYDLKLIYDQINEKYFQNELSLTITWFKKPRYRSFRHLTFGSYNKPLKLIRINKILDDPKVPSYFLEFITYHEMLHHICPSRMDKKGRSTVHTKEFKEKERLFSEYQKAIDWEKKSIAYFQKREEEYGRS